MKRLIKYLLGAAPAVLLLGCQEELSHNKAEQIITTRYKFPITETETIEHGVVSTSTDSLPAYYYALQHQGMLVIEPIGDRTTEIFGSFHQFNVTLTESGKKEIVGNTVLPNTPEDATKSNFRTCQVYFAGIKDVVQSPDKRNGSIQFVVERKNFTPFWSFYTHPNNRMPDTIQSRSLAISKDKDEWRPVK